MIFFMTLAAVAPIAIVAAIGFHVDARRALKREGEALKREGEALEREKNAIDKWRESVAREKELIARLKRYTDPEDTERRLWN